MKKLKNIFYLLTFSIFITGCANTVQKRIMVTKSLKSIDCLRGFGCVSLIENKKNKLSLQNKCMEISFYQSELDRLLEKGAKIVSFTPTQQVVEYVYEGGKLGEFGGGEYRKRTEEGECIGAEYIIEGNESDFKRFLE